jgi:hypothetical protein
MAIKNMGLIETRIRHFSLDFVLVCDKNDLVILVELLLERFT